MPCAEQTATGWWDVPDDAVLSLSLTPSDNEYAQEICLRINADRGADCDEVWSREAVTPGPKEYSLTAPNRYDVEVRLDFLGDTTTTIQIEAEIVGSNGTPYGIVYSVYHSGVSGDSCESLLAILMENMG